MKNSKKYGAKIKLYLHTNRDITYYATYKIGNRKFLKPIGKKSNGWTEKKAFEQRAKLIDKARLGVGVHSNYVTVGDLAKEYFEYAELHNRAYQKTLQNYDRHIADEFDRKIVATLVDRDIVRLQKRLREKKLSNGSINLYVGILTKIINYGVKKGIIEQSPFRDLQKLELNNHRDRFLSKEDIKKLLRVLEDKKELYMFVLLSINTGARATSVLNLKIDDIDFENKKIRIFDYKRNMSYKNPLNSTMIEKLKDIKKGYLIGGDSRWSYQKLYQKLKPILNSLFNTGISKKNRQSRIVIHSLRHTFASHLAIAGTPLQNIKELMNHADIKMTLRYAHLMPDSSAKFLNILYK